MSAMTVTLGDSKQVICKHEESGSVITTMPPAKDGKETDFTPTDLCAASLGMCAMTLMAFMAEKHGLNLQGIKMEVDKSMSREPSAISQIKIKIIMPNGAYTDKDKARMERAIKICPIHNTLAPEVEQLFDIIWP